VIQVNGDFKDVFTMLTFAKERRFRISFVTFPIILRAIIIEH
jgi:hypothetical protein